MDRQWGIFVTIGGMITLTFQMMSLITSHWMDYDDGRNFRSNCGPLNHLGLWLNCNPDRFDLGSGCSGGNRYPVSAAFMTIGCIILCLAFLLSVSLAFGKSNEKVALGCYIIAGLSILIALIAFNVQASSSGYFVFGYSFILGWVSFACSLTMGVVLKAIRSLPSHTEGKKPETPAETALTKTTVE